MRTLLFPLVLSLLLVGCKNASPAAATEADQGVTIAEISVEDTDKAIQAGAVAVDANSERTRKKNGTVPDAIILTEDKSKDLIFYCSSTWCTASDKAAERASTNGYKNVHIMREGIKGWKDAGKATTTYPRS
jgi:rhodanese-related sulfurtransferase